MPTPEENTIPIGIPATTTSGNVGKTPLTRKEVIASGVNIQPLTREELVAKGTKIVPLTRKELFVEERGSGLKNPVLELTYENPTIEHIGSEEIVVDNFVYNNAHYIQLNYGETVRSIAVPAVEDWNENDEAEISYKYLLPWHEYMRFDATELNNCVYKYEDGEQTIEIIDPTQNASAKVTFGKYILVQLSDVPQESYGASEVTISGTGLSDVDSYTGQGYSVRYYLKYNGQKIELEQTDFDAWSSQDGYSVIGNGNYTIGISGQFAEGDTVEFYAMLYFEDNYVFHAITVNPNEWETVDGIICSEITLNGAMELASIPNLGEREFKLVFNGAEETAVPNSSSFISFDSYAYSVRGDIHYIEVDDHEGATAPTEPVTFTLKYIGFVPAQGGN